MNIYRVNIKATFGYLVLNKMLNASCFADLMSQAISTPNSYGLGQQWLSGSGQQWLSDSGPVITLFIDRILWWSV